MAFNRLSGDEVAAAIDARIQSVAQEVFTNSPANRTAYGRVVSSKLGVFSVEINSHIYENVRALRNVGTIKRNESVVCLVPNNEYSNMIIIGVADGSIVSTYVSSIDGETGAITGVPRYVEDSSTTSSISVLLNTIYPVGSVRLSINAGETSFMGGTWVLVSEGRALFGAGTLNGNTYIADGTKDAGLPDHKHFAAVRDATNDFLYDHNGDWNYGISDVTSVAGYQLRASTALPSVGGTSLASRYDNGAIYGNSTTVQPNAYVVYVYKRTA